MLHYYILCADVIMKMMYLLTYNIHTNAALLHSTCRCNNEDDVPLDL